MVPWKINLELEISVALKSFLNNKKKTNEHVDMHIRITCINISYSMIPLTSDDFSPGAVCNRSFGSPVSCNKHFKLSTATEISSEKTKDKACIL